MLREAYRARAIAGIIIVEEIMGCLAFCAYVLIQITVGTIWICTVFTTSFSHVDPLAFRARVDAICICVEIYIKSIYTFSTFISVIITSQAVGHIAGFTCIWGSIHFTELGWADAYTLSCRQLERSIITYITKSWSGVLALKAEGVWAF